MTKWASKRQILFATLWPVGWTAVGVLGAHAALVALLPKDSRYAIAVAICILPSVLLAIPLGLLLKTCPQATRAIIITSACLTLFVSFFGASAIFTGMLQQP